MCVCVCVCHEQGEDVNMKSLMALLTGRHHSNTPLSKRLNTNEDSNVLLFISGHGGDEFMKFQDYEEISAHEIAHGIQEMHMKKRFKNMMLVVDTCQASTLSSLISTPNVISLSSSKKDENSYAYHSNSHLGLSVIDRFSYKLVEYFKLHGQNLKSVGDLYRTLHPRFLQSTPVIEISSGTVGSIDEIPLKWFFDERVVVNYLDLSDVDDSGFVGGNITGQDTERFEVDSSFPAEESWLRRTPPADVDDQFENDWMSFDGYSSSDFILSPIEGVRAAACDDMSIADDESNVPSKLKEMLIEVIRCILLCMSLYSVCFIFVTISY